MRSCFVAGAAAAGAGAIITDLDGSRRLSSGDDVERNDRTRAAGDDAERTSPADVVEGEGGVGPPPGRKIVTFGFGGGCGAPMMTAGGGGAAGRDAASIIMMLAAGPPLHPPPPATAAPAATAAAADVRAETRERAGGGGADDDDANDVDGAAVSPGCVRLVGCSC